MAGRDLNTIDDVRRWLADLPARKRVHVARLLADTRTARELAVLADETVAELFEHGTADQVAEQLDLSVAQVRRAIAQHRARQRRQEAASQR